MSMHVPEVQHAPTKPPPEEGPKPPTPGRGRSLLIVAVILALVAGVAIGIWATSRDGGPVAAEDARIQVTFTGDGTSYSGDREIVEGTARITVINESTEPLAFLAHRYDPGSDELAADPGGLKEGTRFVPGDYEVPESARELLEFDIPTGSETWTLELRPGIYLLDLGSGAAHTTGVWRAGIIEVVAD